MLTDRAARWCFAVAAALAGVLHIVLVGRGIQVGSDDLRFLFDPPAGANPWLAEFAGHWIAAPLAIERVLYGWVGFGAPWLWVAVGTVCWVAGAALVRVIARQSGAGPWVSTIVALAPLCMGAIYPQGQPHSFQVPLAVALGLGYVALCNGRGGWRLAGAVAVGLLAIATSSVGVAFVAAGGVVLWARAGLRLALGVTVALGVVYLGWSRLGGAGVDFGPGGYRPWRQPVSEALLWVWTGVARAGSAMGGFGAIAVALGLGLVVGLALAWRTGARVRLVAPVALLGAVLANVLLTYALRGWFGHEGAADSRYVYVTVMATLPALAVASTALGAVRPVLGWLAPGLLLAAVPANLVALHEARDRAVQVTVAQAQELQALAGSALLDETPDWVVPHSELTFREGIGEVSVAELRAMRDSGKLARVTPWREYETQVPIRLGLATVPADSSQVCIPMMAPVRLAGPVGTETAFVGALSASLVGDPDTSVDFMADVPTSLRITLPGMEFELRAQTAGDRAVICGTIPRL